MNHFLNEEEIFTQSKVREVSRCSLQDGRTNYVFEVFSKVWLTWKLEINLVNCLERPAGGSEQDYRTAVIWMRRPGARRGSPHRWGQRSSWRRPSWPGAGWPAWWFPPKELEVMGAVCTYCCLENCTIRQHWKMLLSCSNETPVAVTF